MELKYFIDDVSKSYRWLGHKEFTELNAYHPEFRPGKENLDWNKKKSTFTKIWYARNEKNVIEFVKKYGPTHFICYGLNPRPQILKTKRGYTRSAKESEIEKSQNLLMDFDFENKDVNKEQIASLEIFLEKGEQYFLDLGFKAPVRAFTGRGYHFLKAYPFILTKDFPDIKERLRYFNNGFRQAFRKELERLEVKLDPSTIDLRRVVKIYGTSKPEVGVISRFYGNKREEDEALRDYLLNLELPEMDIGEIVLKIENELPYWFRDLLEKDKKLNELWEGQGKPETSDTTSSGFDYSVVKKLIQLGYRNIDELSTILALRPYGSFQKHHKNEQYLKRTIANALLKS